MRTFQEIGASFFERIVLKTGFRRSRTGPSQRRTMPETGGDVMRLLGQISARNQDVRYAELRRIAGVQVRREGPGSPLMRFPAHSRIGESGEPRVFSAR